MAYSSSSTAHESFQMSVVVVAIVCPSGLSASGSGPLDRLASVAIASASAAIHVAGWGLRSGAVPR